MGKGGDHPHLPPGVRIPDWRQYRLSRDLNPELWRSNERLIREGLKDPWVRNYAWRYQGAMNPSFATKYLRLFTGLPQAAVLLGLVIAYNHFKEGANDHHGGHGHHHEDDKYKLLWEMETKPWNGGRQSMCVHTQIGQINRFIFQRNCVMIFHLVSKRIFWFGCFSVLLPFGKCSQSKKYPVRPKIFKCLPIAHTFSSVGETRN